MDYQLVWQWSSGSSTHDFDALRETENLLVRQLPHGNKVDGHDIGSGEMSIFIFTNDPLQYCEQVRAILESQPIWRGIGAAWREMSVEEYTVIGPKGHTAFG